MEGEWQKKKCGEREGNRRVRGRAGRVMGGRVMNERCVAKTERGREKESNRGVREKERW